MQTDTFAPAAAHWQHVAGPTQRAILVCNKLAWHAAYCILGAQGASWVCTAVCKLETRHAGAERAGLRSM
jgi:hypothetical protein